MMLCTNCSSPIRPVVAIDIDGTIGDYHGHFLRFAINYLGRNEKAFRDYAGVEKYSEWFCREMNVDLTTFRQVKLAYRQGGLKRTMPVDPYAAALVNRLRVEHDVEVWLTTTRPFLRLDNVDPDTRFWLERHGIKCDGMLYDEGKYRQLADHVDKDRVAAVLDDTPEQYDEAESMFGVTVPIFKAHEYNWQGGRNSVATLQSAEVSIMARVERWRDKHGS